MKMKVEEKVLKTKFLSTVRTRSEDTFWTLRRYTGNVRFFVNEADLIET